MAAFLQSLRELFRSDFFFCFPSSPPPLFLHGWLLNGGPSPTATTATMRWQGPHLLIAGHAPHGRHLPTTCGLHCSPEHTPRLGFWSHQIPASCVTWTTPQRNCPSPTHHEHTPRLLVSSIPRPASHMDHSAAELPKPHPSDVFAPRSASMLHCTYLRAASTIPKIVCRPVLFLRFGAETYSQRPTDKHSGIKGLATGTSLTKIAHRPAYTFADGARLTFAGPPRTTGTAI